MYRKTYSYFIKSKEKRMLNFLIEVSSAFLPSVLFYILLWDDQSGMDTEKIEKRLGRKQSLLYWESPESQLHQSMMGWPVGNGQGVSSAKQVGIREWGTRGKWLDREKWRGGSTPTWMNVTRSLRGRSEGESVAGGTLSPGLDAHSLFMRMVRHQGTADLRVNTQVLSIAFCL